MNMQLLCNDQSVDFHDNMVVSSHSCGFYSCCSVLLYKLIHFWNQFHTEPLYIDTAHSFRIYKSHGNEQSDAKNDFFKPSNHDIVIDKTKIISYECLDEQFKVFTQLNNIDNVIPFVKKYFTPTDEILHFVDIFTEKYNISYNNTCVIFYRGNDKISETPTGNYDDFIQRALNIYNKDNNIQFLVQSDETDFLDYCKTKLPNCIIMYDEIRHIIKNDNTQIDYLNYSNGSNNLYAKYFLAIVIIMAKCKYIIFNSGNISLWIFYYQKIYNNEDVYINQFLLNDWYN
jgi:hypothetical protein